MDNKIELGKIIGVFGTKGQFKALLHYNKPSWIKIGAYAGDGIEIKVDIYPYKSKANMCIVSSGENNLLNMTIWQYRENLPLQPDLIYANDILGSDMLYEGEIIGSLVAIHEVADQDVFECSNGEFFHEHHIDEMSEHQIFLNKNSREFE